MMRRGNGDEKPKPKLPMVHAPSLVDKLVPQRLFLDALEVFPMRNVTLLGGDGGVGKSMLAMQLAVAIVTGTQWLGMDVCGGSVLYYSAEDDQDELHRRLAAITDAEGMGLESLGGLQLAPMAGTDAALVVEKRGAMQLAPTENLSALDAALDEVSPALLVIDNLADVFAGNENSRVLAQAFVSVLRHLAIKHDTTVLLLGHPSLTGRNSGSGESGSTAWNNSVRSRLYLTKTRSKTNGEDSDEVDSDQRWLEPKKANYAALGEAISIRWSGGRFVRCDQPAAFENVSVAHLEAVRTAFREESHWRYDERADDWGGYKVAEVLDLDIGRELTSRDMTKAQAGARRKVKTLLSTWVKTKQLKVVKAQDSKRMERKFYEAV